MKTSKLILLILLLAAMSGCTSEIKQSNDDLIIVDVSKNYPKKELILQDFMDVEYILLETNDDFLCQGIIQTVGKEIILVTNRINDGDVFIFDRNDKGLRKINRKGNSGQEYVYIHDIILNENSDEIYINDNSTRKILVYDLYGNFKRTISHKENTRYKVCSLEVKKQSIYYGQI